MTARSQKMLFITVALVMIATAGISGTIDRVVAKVNEDIITESDMAEASAGRSDSLTTSIVGALFDRTLLLQAARKQKVSVPDRELQNEVERMVREIQSNFPDETSFRRELASENLSLEKFKSKLMEKARKDYKIYHVVSSRVRISDADVERFKHEAAAQGEATARLKLRRLGVAVKKGKSDAARDKTTRLLAKMNSEGLNFADGARKFSEVPGAKEDGGDLGYFSVDELAPEVRRAVENLEPGQASAPVVLGGYASIFYVEEKRGAKSLLTQKNFERCRRELLDELRSRAEIQIYDPGLKKSLPDYYASRVTAGLATTGAQAAAEARAQTNALNQPVATYAPQSEAQAQPASSEQPQRRGLRSLFQRRH